MAVLRGGRVFMAGGVAAGGEVKGAACGRVVAERVITAGAVAAIIRATASADVTRPRAAGSRGGVGGSGGSDGDACCGCGGGGRVRRRFGRYRLGRGRPERRRWWGW